MKRIGLIAAFGLVGVVAAQGQPAPRAPRDVEATVLQAVGDSAQIEVAWGHSTPRSAVRGYIVRVQHHDRWESVDTVPPAQNVDSLWVRRDTITYELRVWVRAKTDGADGPESPMQTLPIPASTAVSAPGAPTVRIISGIGMEPDSITIAGLPDTIARVGDQVHFLPIGWIGRVSMVCGTRTDGSRGWIEVEPEATAEPFGWGPTAGGAFVPDTGCGWTMYSTDPDVATIQPSEVTL